MKKYIIYICVCVIIYLLCKQTGPFTLIYYLYLLIFFKLRMVCLILYGYHANFPLSYFSTGTSMSYTSISLIMREVYDYNP